MAFNKVGSFNPHGAPVLVRRIITNSVVVVVNGSMKTTSGFSALGTTGALVFGHVIAIGTRNQLGMNSTGAAGAEFGSFINTFTAASDNQTVAMVEAECDVSKDTLWSAKLDAAIGTTTGSNLADYMINLADSTQLSESSAAATTLQYHLNGVDPRNSAQAVVNIYQSQVSGV